MRKQQENPFKPIPNKRYVDEPENKVVRDHLACAKTATNVVFDPFSYFSDKHDMVFIGQMGAGKSFFTGGKLNAD